MKTAKEYVKSIMPKAKSEKRTLPSGQEYFTIKDGSLMFASSYSEEGAWKEAKKIINRERK